MFVIRRLKLPGHASESARAFCFRTLVPGGTSSPSLGDSQQLTGPKQTGIQCLQKAATAPAIPSHKPYLGYITL